MYRAGGSAGRRVNGNITHNIIRYTHGTFRFRVHVYDEDDEND